MSRRWLVTALIGLLLPSATLAAGNSVDGLTVAQTWCAACHAIGGETRTTDTAPAFAILARSRTPEQLRNWLTAPHPPMPNPGLSRQAIEDVIAYLQKLKAP
jgi:cytochrome c